MSCCVAVENCGGGKRLLGLKSDYDIRVRPTRHGPSDGESTQAARVATRPGEVTPSPCILVTDGPRFKTGGLSTLEVLPVDECFKGSASDHWFVRVMVSTTFGVASVFGSMMDMEYIGLCRHQRFHGTGRCGPVDVLDTYQSDTVYCPFKQHVRHRFDHSHPPSPHPPSI